MSADRFPNWADVPVAQGEDAEHRRSAYRTRHARTTSVGQSLKAILQGGSARSMGDGLHSWRPVVIRIVAGYLPAVSVGLTFGLISPVGIEESNVASQLAALYFGFLLSAAAIVFAVSFVDQRYWPSIRQVARFCSLGSWLFVGGIATLLSWLGTMLENELFARVAAAAWLASAATGTWSLVQILRYSNATTLNRAMSRVLLAEILRRNSVPSDFWRATREALSKGDPLSIQDLLRQIHYCQVHTPESPVVSRLGLAFTLDVSYSALRGRLDGLSAAETIKQCLPVCAESWDHLGRESDFWVHRILTLAPIFAELEYEARRALADPSANVSDVLAVRAAALQQHRALRLLFDQSPKRLDQPSSGTARAFPPHQAIECYRSLTLHGVPGSESAVYALYEHLTGDRYGRNYYQGAPILADTIRSVRLDATQRSLELVVAEQIMQCTSSMRATGRNAKFHAKEERDSVIAMLRISRSLGEFTSAQEAAASWLKLASWAYLVEPSRGWTDEPTDPLCLAIGLACSHALRMLTPGPDRPAPFLERLPPGVGAAAELQLQKLAATTSENVWGTLARDVVAQGG